MLVTFSCEEYENIIMFGDVAKQLLTLMGHSTTIPGAIVAADISSALARLKRGIEAHKLKTANLRENDDEAPISLALRAIPLIKMLEAADKTQTNVLWN